MSRARPPKWDQPTIAWFLRRRWYMWNVNPPGPEGVFVTEDDAFEFETEDGSALFVTEQAA